jgi:hypothetical protein
MPSDWLAHVRHDSLMNRCSREVRHVATTSRANGHLRLKRAVTFLLPALLAACASRPDLTKQLATVASWKATMQLAATERRSGALTTTYATQLGDEAAQALAEARQSVRSAEHDASDAQRAAAALDSLERAIRQLDTEMRR